MAATQVVRKWKQDSVTQHGCKLSFILASSQDRSVLQWSHWEMIGAQACLAEGTAGESKNLTGVCPVRITTETSRVVDQAFRALQVQPASPQNLPTRRNRPKQLYATHTKANTTARKYQEQETSLPRERKQGQCVSAQVENFAF